MAGSHPRRRPQTPERQAGKAGSGTPDPCPKRREVPGQAPPQTLPPSKREALEGGVSAPAPWGQPRADPRGPGRPRPMGGAAYRASHPPLSLRGSIGRSSLDKRREPHTMQRASGETAVSLQPPSSWHARGPGGPGRSSWPRAGACLLHSRPLTWGPVGEPQAGKWEGTPG